MSYPLEGLPIDEREVLAQANELFVVRGQWTVEQVGLEALSDYVAVEDKTRLPAGVVTAVNRAEENLIQLLLAHNEPVEGYAYVP